MKEEASSPEMAAARQISDEIVAIRKQCDGELQSIRAILATARVTLGVKSASELAIEYQKAAEEEKGLARNWLTSGVAVSLASVALLSWLVSESPSSASVDTIVPWIVGRLLVVGAAAASLGFIRDNYRSASARAVRDQSLALFVSGVFSFIDSATSDEARDRLLVLTASAIGEFDGHGGPMSAVESGLLPQGGLLPLIEMASRAAGVTRKP